MSSVSSDECIPAFILQHKQRGPLTAPLTVALTGARTIKALGLAPLVHEALVEASQALRHRLDLVLLRQEGGPEMPRAVLLPKAGARHHADPRRVEQLQAVLHTAV